MLHRAGLRFRKNLRMDVGGQRVRPDIVFTRSHVVVFVDGCFWHGCPDHGEMPASNREFWEAKIGRTRERDRQQTAALEAAGWRVLRVWEHERIDDALRRVRAAVDSPSWGLAAAEPSACSKRSSAAPGSCDDDPARTVCVDKLNETSRPMGGHSDS